VTGPHKTRPGPNAAACYRKHGFSGMNIEVLRRRLGAGYDALPFARWGRFTMWQRWPKSPLTSETTLDPSAWFWACSRRAKGVILFNPCRRNSHSKPSET